MKYISSLIFILTLGFIIAAAEQHLNVEKTKIAEQNLDIAGEEYVKYEELESHGVPIEFRQNDSFGQRNYQDEDNGEAVPVSSDQIKEPYGTQFEVLKDVALREVTNILQEALEDYHSKKANGEQISYLYFYQTYYPRLKQLESKVDSKFTEKYTQLEEELTQHGFTPESAQKFKEEFELMKQEKLKELMSLVFGN